MSNGNMYAANLRIAWELFAAYLEGNRSGAVVAISESPLPDNARTALNSSMRALGYGDEICTFAVLRSKRAADGNGDGAGGGGDGVGGGGEGEGAGDAGEGASAGRGGAEDGGTGGDGAGGDTDGDACGVRGVFRAPALDGSALRMLVEGLDPLCIIIADRASAATFSQAYGKRCPLDAAGRALGRSVVAFTSFAGLLETPADKQRAWALLKALPRFTGV